MLLVAAPLKVTVQVELPGGVNVPGLHARLANVGPAAGALSVRVAVFDVPFHVAVNTGETVAPTALAALAVKVALIAPVPIVTVPGTVTAGFPLDKPTTVLLVAALVSVAVQVEFPGGVNVPGLHAKLLSVGTAAGGFSVKVAVFEVPFQLAVNTGETLVFTLAVALAVKVVLVAPVPIVTDPGTVTAALPLDRLTTVLPVAALVSVTVQVELPGGVNVPGLHARLLSVGVGSGWLIVIVVPLPERPRLLPLPSVAERFESEMDDEVLFVVGDIWKVATPSVPFGTSVVVEVRLMIRQFALVAPVEHESTSPDKELTEDEGVICTELKSVEEKLKTHWAPVG